MEICQHCGMYMKPFVNREKGEVTCEFCGKVIANKVDGKWEKVSASPSGE